MKSDKRCLNMVNQKKFDDYKEIMTELTRLIDKYNLKLIFISLAQICYARAKETNGQAKEILFWLDKRMMAAASDAGFIDRLNK